MTRRKPKIGSVVQLALPDGRFAYGRVLRDASLRCMPQGRSSLAGRQSVNASMTLSSVCMTTFCELMMFGLSVRILRVALTTNGLRPTVFATHSPGQSASTIAGRSKWRPKSSVVTLSPPQYGTRRN